MESNHRWIIPIKLTRPSYGECEQWPLRAISSSKIQT